MTRPWLIVIAGLLVLGGFGIALFLLLKPSTDGPIQAREEIEIEMPLPSGESGTWGMVLPTNPTSSPIVIESIEAVGPAGLTILGIVVNDPDVDGGIGTALGYPPEGATMRSPVGAVLPPAGSASPNVQVLVGVEREGSGEGRIDGLKVEYTLDGTRYEEVLPYSLVVP
jgi:hypothetical protein